ncbi:CoA ligase [Pseudomassariella vexata]|uniref:CoA ligase n=1 Tax=Pseudomassariella vexata TaxID=1141098 RepID=A0A1Y2EBW1_9PEZI|nr:CoA ligase [Pseudomassariella vexata]ORY69032.1 CoA ligase [Pseudomassariella vexata]
MTFKSQSPDIDLPHDLSLWSWLFDSTQSCLSKYPRDKIQGFTNVVTKQHVSFQDVERYTTYVSTALTTLCGLREGDVVIVYGKNSIWYPVATLSAVRVGAVACGISPEYNIEELCFSLQLSKAKFIMATVETADKACAAAAKSGIPKENVILMDGARVGMMSIQRLLQLGESRGEMKQVRPYQIPKGKSNGDVCAYLCFSSGTTGLPKAVMVSHANIIAQCLQVQQITPPDHDKVLAALPFYHITGIVHQLHLPILLNAHVYVLPTFTLDALLQTVADYKVKELLIVPPILIRMVRDEQTVSKYDLSHVKRFSSGAAPLSQEILALLESRFPGTGFKQGYGMTESCSAITSHPPSKYAYKYADKVGMVVGSTEVRVVNPETGEDCKVGEAGEIWARGPQVAMGYLNNPKATAETFDKDGFLHTGDIGKFDDEGLLSITDRMKEMIKVKGIGVAPAELENLLLGHPSVSDAAVLGIPDETAGERPKAYVVLNPAGGLSPADAGRALIQLAKSSKARHKWIAEVEIVHEIPKSPAGKILRRKLRETSPQSSGNVIVQDESRTSRL